MLYRPASAKPPAHSQRGTCKARVYRHGLSQRKTTSCPVRKNKRRSHRSGHCRRRQLELAEDPLGASFVGVAPQIGGRYGRNRSWGRGRRAGRAWDCAAQVATREMVDVRPGGGRVGSAASVLIEMLAFGGETGIDVCSGGGGLWRANGGERRNK